MKLFRVYGAAPVMAAALLAFVCLRMATTASPVPEAKSTPCNCSHGGLCTCPPGECRCGGEAEREVAFEEEQPAPSNLEGRVASLEQGVAQIKNDHAAMMEAINRLTVAVESLKTTAPAAASSAPVARTTAPAQTGHFVQYCNGRQCYSVWVPDAPAAQVQSVSQQTFAQQGGAVYYYPTAGSYFAGAGDCSTGSCGAAGDCSSGSCGGGSGGVPFMARGPIRRLVSGRH